MRGPASLAYGSNCLGGIINFVTRKCPFGFTDTGHLEYGGRYKFSAGSAAEDYHGRAEQWLVTPRLRLFMGGSARSVGDTAAAKQKLQAALQPFLPPPPPSAETKKA